MFKKGDIVLWRPMKKSRGLMQSPKQVEIIRSVPCKKGYYVKGKFDQNPFEVSEKALEVIK